MSFLGKVAFIFILVVVIGYIMYYPAEASVTGKRLYSIGEKLVHKAIVFTVQATNQVMRERGKNETG